MGKSIKVLDKGEVILHDVMGNDLMVVNAARTSFNKRSEWQRNIPDDGEHYGWIEDNIPASIQSGYLSLKDADVRLINSFAKNGHFSPFTHPQVHLEFKLPGVVLDQLIKHRIGISHSDDEAFQAWQNAGDNQLSMRYKEPQDFYIPGSDEWRGVPDHKKQGSKGFVDPLLGSFQRNQLIGSVEVALERYHAALAEGVAPEQARLFLPYYSMYTNRVWTSSLYGIINLLNLRLPDDAQFEIRKYAEAVKTLVQPLFPYSFAAFGLED